MPSSVVAVWSRCGLRRARFPRLDRDVSGRGRGSRCPAASVTLPRTSGGDWQCQAAEKANHERVPIGRLPWSAGLGQASSNAAAHCSESRPDLRLGRAACDASLRSRPRQLRHPELGRPHRATETRPSPETPLPAHVSTRGREDVGDELQAGRAVLAANPRLLTLSGRIVAGRPNGLERLDRYCLI
jgi:hypothetical protein